MKEEQTTSGQSKDSYNDETEGNVKLAGYVFIELTRLKGNKEFTYMYIIIYIHSMASADPLLLSANFMLNYVHYRK